MKKRSKTRDTFSSLVHGWAWCQLGLALLLGFPTLFMWAQWMGTGREADPYGVLGLGILQLILGFSVLVSGTIPSGILYASRLKRTRKDWISLCLSSGTLLLLIAEFVMLCGTPSHGSC